MKKNKIIIMNKFTYKIIANRNASQFEIDSLRLAAEESGLIGVEIEKSGGTTSLGADGFPEVILVVQYLGAVLGAGIIAAIGVDVWNQIKHFATKAFKSYDDKFHSEKQWIYNPLILINIIVDGKSKFQIHFPRKSFQELEESLLSLEESLVNYHGEEFVVFQYINNQWGKTHEPFKNQEELRDDFFKHYDNVESGKKDFNDIFNLLGISNKNVNVVDIDKLLGDFDIEKVKNLLSTNEQVKNNTELLNWAVRERFKTLSTVSALAAMLLIIATFNERLIPLTDFVRILLSVLLFIIPLSLCALLYELYKAESHSIDKIKEAIKKVGGPDISDKIEKEIRKSIIRGLLPWFINGILSLAVLIIIVLIWVK